jgi:trimeric autotransporter adhesin
MVVSGTDELGQPYTKVYRQQANGNYELAQTLAPIDGKAIWIDYDGSGQKNDILLSGKDKNGNIVTEIYQAKYDFTSGTYNSFTKVNLKFGGTDTNRNGVLDISERIYPTDYSMPGVYQGDISWQDLSPITKNYSLTTSSLKLNNKYYQDFDLSVLSGVAGKVGQSYTIGLSSASFDTELQIIDANNNAVGYKNYSWGGSNALTTFTYQSGYKIRVSSFSDNQVGAFKLSQPSKMMLMTGFSEGNRRTADGKIVPVPVTKVYQFDAATGAFFDTNIGLSGVANSSTKAQDYDGDGDLDLLVTGEDIFVRPDDQASLSASQMQGGNPTTTIYRNDSYIDPTTGKMVLRFTNPVFTVNQNDKRWSNFNYQFESSTLTTAGVYELKGIAYDHATAGLELAPGYGGFTNLTTLTGTAGQNVFVIGNKIKNFYNTRITIEGFNPNLDVLQLYYNQDIYAIESINNNTDTLVRIKTEAERKTQNPLNNSKIGLETPNLEILIKGVQSTAINLSNGFTEGNVIFADPKRDDSESVKFAINSSGGVGNDILTAAQGDVISKEEDFAEEFFPGQFSSFGALAGGAGNDTLTGSQSLSDTKNGVLVTYLDGGAGNDNIKGSNLNLDAQGKFVTDILLGWEGDDILQGLQGRNILDGGDGNDSLIGGSNSDTLIGGKGNDSINGGTGVDTVVYSKDPGGVNVNLTTYIAKDGYGNTDTFVSVAGLSSVENAIGSNYNDTITGDRQHNQLSGLGGNDTLNGEAGNDTLDGGTGNDIINGGEGFDTLISGGGADILAGGKGVDTYIVRSSLLTLEQAFAALGGDYKTKGKITAKIDGENKDISWEMFRLWTDASRWNGQIQWEKFRQLGFEPDQTLYGQSSTNPQQGWLRPSIAGTVIREENSEEDTLIIAANAPLSKTGLQAGKIGFAQAGNDLILDLDKDGIADGKKDLTIKDFFNGNEGGAGSISTIRVAGLEATYYKGTDFTDPITTVIDSNINFSWGDKSPAALLGKQPNNFGVIWQGFLKTDATGSYKFRFNTDTDDPATSAPKYRLFVNNKLFINDSELINLSANQEYSFRLEYTEISGDASAKLEWSVNGSEFGLIPEQQFLSPQTLGATEIINTNRGLTPILQEKLDITTTKDWQSTATFGDYNNDGYLDFLVVGSDAYGNGVARIYQNIADTSPTTLINPRTFNQSIELNQLERFETAVWGDYNNDGYLDILATGINTIVDSTGKAIKQYQVKVLLNQNGQKFTEFLVKNLTDSTELITSTQVNWADLNNDGKLDIITTNKNQVKVFYQGQLNPTVITSSVQNGKINLGDLDKDSYIDIVLAGKETTQSSLELKAEVSLSLTQELSPKFDRFFTNSDPAQHKYLYKDFIAADFKSEAPHSTLVSDTLYQVEIANGSFDTYLQIIDKNGKLVTSDDDSGEGLNSLVTFTYKDGYKIRVTSYAASATGTFNLSVKTVNSTVEILQNNSGQNWRPKTQKDLNLKGSETLALGDYDQDGKIDLLLTGKDRTKVYQNKTSGDTLKFEEFSGKTLNGELKTTSALNPLRLGYDSATNTYIKKDKYYQSYSITDFVTNFSTAESLFLKLDSNKFDAYLQIVKPDSSAPGGYRQLAVSGNTDGTSNALLQFDYTSDLQDAQVWVTTYYAGKTGAYTLYNAGVGLPSVENNSATWGDYDNDGDLDVAISGLGDNGSFTKVFLNPVVGESTNQRFTELPAFLPGLQNGSSSWGDYDKDGDLDLLLTGTLGTLGTPFFQVYRNTIVDEHSIVDPATGLLILDDRSSGSPNVSPTLPSLTATPQAGGANGIQLSWNDASVGEEPYTYNLKVGTTTGGFNVLSPGTNNLGQGTLSQVGNVGFNTNKVLTNLAKGVTHYWSVQSVDNGFRTSAFSVESSFTTNPFSIDLAQSVTMPGNYLMADYDRDRDLDRLSVSATQTKIDRNDAGVFATVTTLAGANQGSWADIDNDGDLDLLLNSSTASTLYRNTNGTFTAVTPTSPGATNSSWADIDNDGDVDLLLNSSTASTLYRNTNGTFAAIAPTLLGATRSTWGDFDNDGDLDLLLTDATKTSVYKNNAGTFALQTGTLKGGTSVVTGDYDHDGLLDVAILGTEVTIVGPQVTIYRGVATGFETYIDQISHSATYNTITQVDNDKDGDLDLLLSVNGSGAAQVLRNDAAKHNTAPVAPNLFPINTSLVAGTPVTLKWTGASDAETPAAGLTYNLRVRNSSGANILSIPVNAQGQPIQTQLGNVGQGKKEIDGSRSWALNGLAPGKYFWSVQAVDGSLVASTFSAEQTFTVLPTVSFLTPTLTVTEGNSGESEVLLTVKLSQASLERVSVDYSMFAGATDNSTPGEDFQPLSGTIVFEPNTTTQTIKLKIVGDILPEQLETFTVSLQNFVNALAIPGQDRAKITIASESNDGVVLLPDLEVSQISSPNTITQRQTVDVGWTVNNIGTGGDSQVPYLSYIYLSTDDKLSDDDQFVGRKWQQLPTAGKTQSLSQSITIPYDKTITTATTRYLIVAANPTENGGEANPVNNFFTRKITINPGQLPKFTFLSTNLASISTAVAGSQLDITSSIKNNGLVAAQAGWKTQAYWSKDNILDRDDLALAQTSVTTTALAAGATGTFTTKVTLPNTTAANQGYLFVKAIPADGDYDSGDQTSTPKSGLFTLTFGQPEISLTVSTKVLEDGINKADGTGKAAETITYTFTRTGNLTTALTVNFSVGGTAQLTTDYTQTGAASYAATTGTITFAAGAATAVLTLTPVVDLITELDETINLTLTAGTGYTIKPTASTTSASIVNDDALNDSFVKGIILGGTNLTINGANRYATRESGEPALINDSIGNSVWYFWTPTTNMSIEISVDSSEFDPLLGIFKGNSIATLQPVISDDDSGVGQNSLVRFDAKVGTRYAIAVDGANDNTGNFVLKLTDARPSLTISDITAIERDGIIQAELTITLSKATTAPVTVNYATANGTATSGLDYTAITGTLTFNVGETVKKVFVPILADTLAELKEAFTLTLSNPSVNVRIDRPTATVSIEDTIKSATTVTLAAIDRNLLLTGAANINVTGNALDNILLGNTGANTLTGGAGNDTLDGGLGIDTLVGGLGNDLYIVDTTTDTITELVGEGTDTIQSAVTFSLAALTNVENLTLTGTTAINATGNTGNNSLIGNSANNTLTGDAGNDTLTGGLGIDTLVGGIGDDIYVVDTTTDIITELVSAGTDTIQSAVTFSLAALTNVENLTLTGTTAINGTGNVGNNTLIGNSVNNTLDGGLGNDILVGGLGDDIYVVDTTTDVITELVGAGTDTVQSSVTFSLAALTNVENLTLTGTTAINATGNAGHNTIIGNSAENILTGGAGNDLLDGGAGNDTIEESGDVDFFLTDTELVNSNIVETQTTVNSGTAIGMEIRINGTDTLSQIDKANLTGGVGSNRLDASGFTLGGVILNGGAGNDILIGGAGNDTLDGGDGNDLSIGSGNVNFTLTNTQLIGNGIDTLISIEQVQLIGGIGNNTLNAAAFTLGDVILDGGAGNDTLIGGTGNNTYVVDSTSDIVTESSTLATSIDTVEATINYSLAALANIEHLTLTGQDNLNGIGNSKDNKITGNAGNNQLTGGAGNDLLDGGAGVDTAVESGDVNFILTNTQLTGNGTDSLISIEQAQLTGGIGNNTIDAATFTLGDVTLNGGAGNDILTSGAGSDFLTGGAGNDILNGGLGIDTVVESGDFNFTLTDTQLTGNGTDSLNSIEKAHLIGGIGNNTIDATQFTGDVTLNGGAGNDILKGGTGNDTYIVDSIGDMITDSTVVGSIDTVRTSISYTLGANLEHLTLTGTTALNGTGNAANNTIIGNSANNTLTGAAGNDTLIGGFGNDTLDGGIGNDTLVGGLGNDIYVVDSSTDIVIENAGQGTDIVQSSATYSLSTQTNVENLTLTGTTAINGTGNTANNILIGNSAANTLTGDAGNDTLDGGLGIDTLIGGVGDDIYLVDTTTDIITELTGAGTDIVQSSVTFSLSALTNIENLTLTGTTVISGTGNAGNNILIGNSAANTLTGDAGNDTLDGGLGIDTLVGGLGDDIYLVDTTTDIITELAGAGTDTVQSSVTLSLAALTEVENLTLTGINAINGTGNAANNTIIGNSANNILDGGLGIDTLIGGVGDDIYLVDTTTDIITELTGAGTDTIQSSVTYSLSALTNVENLTLTGTTVINGTGNAANNTIIGNSANNILTGGEGIDILQGGAGDDIYVVDTSTDIITESVGQGIDTVQSSVDFNLGSIAEVENLTLIGTTAINGTGNSGNNTLVGNSINNTLIGAAGNDTLNGGLGIDTLIGGVGDDIYVVDTTTDIITEITAQGTDTIQSSVTFSLSALAYLENLTLTGTTAINATGNAANNTLIGNSATNILTGDLGNDTLEGGLGIDTLIGGLGDDIYVVDTTTDIITELVAQGTDTVQSSVTFSLSALTDLEHLTLTGTTAINATGNAANNTLKGNNAANTLTGELGNDTLDGGLGIDTLIGGLGDDIYVVDTTTDMITELVAQGTDTIQSSVTFSLAALANVEYLTLTGTTAINATGNAANNILRGNSAANTLSGEAGSDYLLGGAGNDILTGGDGSDVYAIDADIDLGIDTINETLTGGVDTLDFRSSSTDVNINLNATNTQNIAIGVQLVIPVVSLEYVYGGSGNDRLTGNNFNNFIFGGAGSDTLNGGDGSDSFYFAGGILAATTAIATQLGKDKIGDFTSGQDKLVLSKATFSAITSAVGVSIGTDFTTVANDSLVDTQTAKIVYSQGTGNLFYNQNGSIAGFGDNGGNFAVLTTTPTLVASDFTISA